MPQEEKIFPHVQWSQDCVLFEIDDVWLEIYLYSERQLEVEHPRQQQATREFKNYDYMLECTKNKGPLLVPLMALFEYKGFCGMGKTLVPQHSQPLPR